MQGWEVVAIITCLFVRRVRYEDGMNSDIPVAGSGGGAAAATAVAASGGGGGVVVVVVVLDVLVERKVIVAWVSQVRRQAEERNSSGPGTVECVTNTTCMDQEGGQSWAPQTRGCWRSPGEGRVGPLVFLSFGRWSWSGLPKVGALVIM